MRIALGTFRRAFAALTLAASTSAGWVIQSRDSKSSCACRSMQELSVGRQASQQVLQQYGTYLDRQIQIYVNTVVEFAGAGLGQFSNQGSYFYASGYRRNQFPIATSA